MPKSLPPSRVRGLESELGAEGRSVVSAAAHGHDCHATAAQLRGEGHSVGRDTNERLNRESDAERPATNPGSLARRSDCCSSPRHVAAAVPDQAPRRGSSVGDVWQSQVAIGTWEEMVPRRGLRPAPSTPLIPIVFFYQCRCSVTQFPSTLSTRRPGSPTEARQGFGRRERACRPRGRSPQQRRDPVV